MMTSDLQTAWGLRRCLTVGKGTRARGRVWVHGGGDVIIGRGVFLDASVLPIELHAGPGATLRLGDGSRVEGGASIEAMRRVTIGDSATVGRLCKIMDCHFHSLTGDRLASPSEGPEPVSIGDHANIGANAIVLPGTHVANGAQVAAGTVVRTRAKGAARAQAPPARSPRSTSFTWVGEAVNARTLPREPSYFFDQLRRVAALAIDDPRAATARLLRGVGFLRARAAFRGCACGPFVHVSGPVRVSARGKITLGERVQIWPGMIPCEFVCDEGACLDIGASTAFNYGARVHAARSVRIGRRCLFASMTTVRDHANGQVADVTIEDDVWVAYGASVEPGAHIGRGSVVAAGTAARGEVPPFSLVIGDPAVVKPLRVASASR
jgi:acetyltransferase-like isoleucine patch superfamily enzyme